MVARYNRAADATSPPNSGRSFVDLSRDDVLPALIVIDMQNGFVASGAPFEVPHARAIVPHINRLVTAWRQSGLPIIWVRGEYSQSASIAMHRKFPMLALGSLRRGDTNFEYFEELIAPDESEQEIVKPTYDAYRHTTLDAHLRALGVNSIVVAGVSTEACCDSTVRSGFMLGYLPVIIRDATAASGGLDFQELVLGLHEHFFARVMTTAEACEEAAARP